MALKGVLKCGSVVAATCVGAVMMATPALADGSSVIDPSDASLLALSGVQLTDEEQGSAAVVLLPDPGTIVTATVRPKDCDSEDCEIDATAQGPTLEEDLTTIEPVSKKLRNNPRRHAVGLNGSKVLRIKVRRSAKTSPKPDAGRAFSRAAGKPIILVNRTGSSYDKVCSHIGCGQGTFSLGWRLGMNQTTYMDPTHAWGTRQRYGLRGHVDYDLNAKFASWSNLHQNFVNDPSPHALYANVDGVITAGKGPATAQKSHYVHRHTQGWSFNPTTWLVVK